ncbi:hypothetical protein NM688_g3711 [Phlebia brevispora]|uniref:Uncharacterized protein n=1 Tax=Phlebia brevispora TaxID=194682 RepID=A0ACC1T4Y6_9APHY|nr:hypothetical protein NM688_g3711 [Phlebia brevispora]
MMPLSEEECAHERGPLRELTIYSNEAPREKAEVEVPVHVKYTTTSPVIPSSLVNQPCADLDAEAAKHDLPNIVPADTPGLLPVLQ